MAIDSDLLDILVCPRSRTAVRLVELPAPLRGALREKYREHFRDEEPEVTHGLLADASQLVYPIVSSIPMMLEEEALPASALEEPPAAS